MKQITVKENEAGQRLDKLLLKYLNKAPKSFIYKMLRKKNIKLNGKKAEGNEKLQVGDEVTLFLSEETIAGFQEEQVIPCTAKSDLDIVYEDEHLLFINKPAGMLSQKAEQKDVSLVEHVISYLLESGQLTREDLRNFRPGICNRLDRNTSGLVVAGKSLTALQDVNALFKERSLHKYYRCIVKGSIQKPQRIEGWLWKDEKTNQVFVYPEEKQEALPICTEYQPLQSLRIGEQNYTYLEVNLITGRSHQIRAHLASIGHPLVGDSKYGNARVNEYFRREFGLKHQLLHAYRLELPELSGALKKVSGQKMIAPLPSRFADILKRA